MSYLFLHVRRGTKPRNRQEEEVAETVLKMHCALIRENEFETFLNTIDAIIKIANARYPRCQAHKLIIRDGLRWWDGAMSVHLGLDVHTAITLYKTKGYYLNPNSTGQEAVES